MPEEMKHNYGTPITSEPGSVKELFKMFLDLASRVDTLEATVEAPKKKEDGNE